MGYEDVVARVEGDPGLSRLGTPIWDEGFWDETPRLRVLKAWAKYVGPSPWTLLGAALARVSAEDAWTHRVAGLRPEVRQGVSGALYIIGVGGSGGGKGLAYATVSDMIDFRGGHLLREMRDRHPPTPEGGHQMFLDKVSSKSKSEGGEDGRLRPWRQVAWNALCYFDEVGTLMKVSGRSGNPLREVMSTWWGGSWPGNDSKSESRPGLDFGTHLSMYAGGVRETVAVDLLAAGDITQGFVNRLIFMEGHDLDPVWEMDAPGRLEIFLPNCRRCDVCGSERDFDDPLGDPASSGRQVYIWPEVREVVDDVRRIKFEEQRSELDPGHRLLNRRKVAKALSLFHNELGTSWEMWMLAGRVLDHSDELRRELIAMRPRMAVVAAQDKRAVRVADSRAVSAQPEKTAWALNKVRVKLENDFNVEGSPRFMRTQLGRAAAGRPRNFLDMNPEDVTDQIVIHLLNAHLDGHPEVSWEGRDDGRDPMTDRTRFFYLQNGVDGAAFESPKDREHKMFGTCWNEGVEAFRRGEGREVGEGSEYPFAWQAGWDNEKNNRDQGGQ